MVGSQIRTDSGGIKVKVFLYNPLVNFLKLNTLLARKLFFLEFQFTPIYVDIQKLKLCITQQFSSFSFPSHQKSYNSVLPVSHQQKVSHLSRSPDTEQSQHPYQDSMRCSLLLPNNAILLYFLQIHNLTTHFWEQHTRERPSNILILIFIQ